MPKIRKYLKPFLIFLTAFFVFYGVQTLVFSQEFLVASSQKTEAKAETNDEAEASLIEDFDQKVDEFIVDSGAFIARVLGLEEISPLVVTLILAPLFVLAIYLFGWILRLLIIRPLLALWATKATKAEDKARIQNIRKVLSPFFITLGLRVAVVPIEAYFNQKLVFLRNPIQAVLIVTAALILQRIIVSAISVWGNTLAQKTESDLDDQIMPILLGLSKSVIMVFGVLFGIAALGVNMGPVIASLGAASFALGFAVKDSLSNFIGGIFLIMENAFNVGDKVDIAGIGTGFIHEIGLRTTKVRTFDHEVIVIPNNMLMNKEYKNFRLPTLKIRIVVNFGVAYGSDLEKVREICWKVLSQIEGKLDDPAPAVEFYEMADFSLNFALKFYVGDFNHQHSKKLEATDKLYQALTDGGIDIPYPTYTIEQKK